MPFIQHDDTEDEGKESRDTMSPPNNSKRRSSLSISIPPSSPPPSSQSSPPSSPPSSQSSLPSSQKSPSSSSSSPPPPSASSQGSPTLSFTTAPEYQSPTNCDFYPQPPAPPTNPLPWQWKCHTCRQVWRVSTTQRCLNCGHQMCFGPKRARRRDREEFERRRKRIKRSSSTLAGRTAHGKRLPLTWWQLNRLKPGIFPRRLWLNRNPFRVKRIVRPCLSQFDYTGWESWNAWRRDIKKYRDNEGRENDSLTDGASVDSDDNDSSKEEQAMTIRPTQGRLALVNAKNGPPSHEPLPHNCWNECNFPSQCKDAGKRPFFNFRRVK